MNRPYLFLLLFVLCACRRPTPEIDQPGPSTSETFLVHAGGKGSDGVHAADVDRNRDIFITGKSTSLAVGDTLYFGNNRVRTLGTDNLIVARYDPFGNALWVRMAGGRKGWAQGDAIAADHQGGCYVAGSFGGEMQFDQHTLTAQTDPASGLTRADLFLARYDPQGGISWIKQVTGTGYEHPAALQVDQAGNVVVTGRYFQQIDFGGTRFTVPGEGFFLAKYTAAGGLLWAKSFGSGLHGSFYPSKVRVDANENIILAGSYTGDHDIGGIRVQSGGQDAFLAKFDAAGNVQWVKSFGSSEDDMGLALAVDPSGNLYTGGSFRTSVTVDGFTLAGTGTWARAFFAKFTAGGTLAWLKAASGSAEERVSDMYLQNDTLYALGYFSDGFTLDHHTVNRPGPHIFVTKHDVQGLLTGFISTYLGQGMPVSIHVDAAGYSLVTGYFRNAYSPLGLHAASHGDVDLFLLKARLPFQ